MTDLVDIPDLRDDFLLIPSLAVMGRTPVWVSGERYSFLEVEGRRSDVLEVASLMLNRMGRLHYLDILGYRKGQVDWGLLRDVADIGGELWADVGAEYSETLIDALMSGATMCIVSTKMIEGLNEIAAAFELTENIALQIDHEEGVISKDRKIRKMSPVELVEELSSLGIRDFIFDELSADKGPVDQRMLKDMLDILPKDGRLLVGVNSIEEAAKVSGAGAHGAVLSCSKLLKGV